MTDNQLLFLNAQLLQHLRATPWQSDADASLQQTPLSVMDKTAVPPSGDKHDYMSVGPYWWPDPKSPTGLPYVRRDGELNPETALFDRVPLDKTVSAVTKLALGFHFSRRADYAQHAAKLLQTWFLDPPTRMNPHLKFGQAIPGRTQGRGIGIIDTKCLMELPDALALLAQSPAWCEADTQGLRDWFARYSQWLLESDLGRAEMGEKNNHGTYFDAQVGAFAWFCGQKEVAVQATTRGLKRIEAQIKADGRQPLELARTRSLSYSVMNLRGFFCLVRLGEHAGVALLPIQFQRLQAAMRFLAPFCDSDTPWPHAQIVPFERSQLREVLRNAPDSLRENPTLTVAPDQP